MTDESSETSRDELLAAADEALTQAAFRTGEFDDAQRLARQAAQQAAEHGDRAGEAAAAVISGFVLHYENIAALMRGAEVDPAGTAAEAESFERASALYEELGDAAGMARAAFGLGVFEQVLRDDWDAAAGGGTDAGS